MSWQEFRSQVKTRGIARTNRYRVVIPFPTTDSDGITMAELFCEAVNIPGLNIATTPQRVFGEVRELPYEKMYEAVSMTFYVDTQMTMKSAFDRWMALVIDPERRTVQYYENYIKDIEIYVISVDGKTPYKVTLYEAYPKSIGSVSMSAESRDVMRLQVTFQYKYWRAESTKVTAADIRPNKLSNITPSRNGVFVGPPIPPSLLNGSTQYQQLIDQAAYEGTTPYI